MDNKKDYLLEQLETWNIHTDETQLDQLMDFYRLLLLKNTVMNLTRITEFEDVVRKHYIDSLAIGTQFDLSGVKHILDLGTGAGFPGIPLKIIYPDKNFILVDSVGKKIQFITDVIRELGLTGIAGIHSRAEDLAGDRTYREKQDLCVSRAVANLSTLSEYCMPFVRVGGQFIAYKGGDSRDEILAAGKAIKTFGGKQPEIREYELYDMKRTLVSVRKIKKTPVQYPRKAGTPSKTPI